jgi:hypothetical protein
MSVELIFDCFGCVLYDFVTFAQTEVRPASTIYISFVHIPSSLLCVLLYSITKYS